jgi:hypothetical protein
MILLLMEGDTDKVHSTNGIKRIRKLLNPQYVKNSIYCHSGPDPESSHFNSFIRRMLGDGR